VSQLGALISIASNLMVEETSPIALGSVTIGDLKRAGKLLELECAACHRHLYEDPAKFPFDDAEPVPGLARRLRCSKCGARNTDTWFPIHCRPDARPPPMGASTPAH
jgi:hypothetical protein